MMTIPAVETVTIVVNTIPLPLLFHWGMFFMMFIVIALVVVMMCIDKFER